ncbi:hypothetical protein EDD86DRAFT_80730 [Gorgonomyces haynaldii]|nr:hypothetical protein EDD86DRAFT_80730 [Gorgonomyces haynaldii]
MGRYIDGSFFYIIPRFDRWDDYVTVIFFSAVALSHFLLLGYYSRMLKSGVAFTRMLVLMILLFCIFDILACTYYYFDAPPIINAIYAPIGYLAGLQSILVDSEILKIFCIFSNYVSPQLMTRMQILLCILHFGCNHGIYLRIGYAGQKTPAFVDFSIYKLSLFYGTISAIFQIVQCLYVVYLSWGQSIKIKAELSSKNNQVMQKEYRQLAFLILLYIILYIVGYVLSYFTSFAVPGDSPNIQILYGAFAGLAPIASALVLEKIKAIRFYRSDAFTITEAPKSAIQTKNNLE